MAAETNYTVKLNLVSNSDGAQKELKKTNQEVSNLQKAVNRAASSFKNLDVAVKNIGKSLDRLGSTFQRVGGDFTRFVTLPIAAFAALGIGDKLNGEFAALGAEAKKMGDSFAQFLLPIFQTLIGYVQNAIIWFNNLDDSLKQKIFLFASIAAAIGPVLIVLGGLTKIIGTVVTAVGSLITVGKVLIALLAGPAGIALAAVALVTTLAGLVNVFFKLREATGSWLEALKKIGIFIGTVFLNGAIQPLLMSIQAVLFAYEKLLSIVGMSGLSDAARAARENVSQFSGKIKSLMVDSFNDIGKDLESVGSSWADAMTFGLSTKIGEFLNDFDVNVKAKTKNIKKEIELVSVDLNQLIAGQLSGLIGNATTDIKNFGQAFKDFAKNAVSAISQTISQMLILNALRRSFPSLNSVGGGNNATPLDFVGMGRSVVGRARGGMITGPGTGTSDSIPIMASNGEYMMSAKAVQNIGAENMHAIHMKALGRKGYADGGLIQSQPSISINNTGTAKTVSDVSMRDGIVSIVLSDLSSNGPLTKGIRSRFNLKTSGSW